MKQILKAHGEEVARLQAELETEKIKNQRLCSKTKGPSSGGGNIVLDDEQLIEVEELRTTLGIMTARVQKYETEKRMMERDIRSAYIAMEEARAERDVVAEDVTVRKSRLTKSLTRQLEDAEQREGALKLNINDMEVQMSQLRDELRSSEERNSWYEKGNGLTEMAQCQKKLEADIRRREVDFQRCLLDVNQKNDRIGTLERLCEAMKDKMVSSCHDVDTEELETIIKVEEHGLRGQNTELSKQVEALEEERNALLQRLRKNAAMISEDGIRFLGLSSEQMVLLVEFANNLKEGNIDLPLDNRSTELSAELKSLKVTRQSDLMCIERLEREIETLKTMKGLDDTFRASELRGILDGIEAQNKSLREQVEALTNPTNACLKDDVVDIPPTLRSRIKTIIGEDVDNMPSAAVYHQFISMMREYEKLDTELRTIRESAAFRNFQHDQPMKIIQCEDFSKQAPKPPETYPPLKENIPPVLRLVPSISLRDVETRNAQVQVGSGNGYSDDVVVQRKLQKELQLVQEQLITSRAMLSASDAKVSRLQQTLNQQSLVKSNKTRIDLAAAAVKELKSCLEEKNKLIAKYRAKDLLRNRPAMTSSREIDQSRDVLMEKKGHRHTPSVSEEDNILPLVKQLERSSILLKEKEANIESIRTMVHRKQIENRDLEFKQQEKDETIERLKEEMKFLLQQIEDTHNQRNQWQNEKISLLSGIEELKRQVHAKEERIAQMTKTLTRRVTSIRTKNDELAKLSNVESELKRVKTLLNVSKSKYRSCKDKNDKTLATSQRKAEDALANVMRMQSDVSKLRKEVTQLKDEKHLIAAKARKQTTKIQELKDIVQNYGGNDHELEDEYKRKILTLQTDNSKLRGLVASYKLKNGIDAMTKHFSRESGIMPDKASSCTVVKQRDFGREHPTKTKKNKDAIRKDPNKSGPSERDENWQVLQDDYEKRIQHLTKQLDQLTKHSPSADMIGLYKSTNKELKMKNEALQRDLDQRIDEWNILEKEVSIWGPSHLVLNKMLILS